MTSPLVIDRLRVGTPQGDSGIVARTGTGYLFGYHADAARASEISLLMPLRPEQYASRELHPILQMNLPEGHVLERLRQRLAKAIRMDPMLLLALTGGDAPIGRVHVEASAHVLEALLPGETGRGEHLSQILAWDGAEDLFEELARRYLFRTGISGMQPKLLVPEAREPGGKVSLATTDLIVTSGGSDYPGLATNEFVCMSITRDAGIPVPEFFLSDNRRLFVMRRFDRAADGTALGFEEMAVLMALGAAQKVRGQLPTGGAFRGAVLLARPPLAGAGATVRPGGAVLHPGQRRCTPEELRRALWRSHLERRPAGAGLRHRQHHRLYPGRQPGAEARWLEEPVRGAHASAGLRGALQDYRSAAAGWRAAGDHGAWPGAASGVA